MAETLIVEGGPPLAGEVKVSGAKNAALPIMTATLLASSECELNDIPQLKDVRHLADILKSLGAEVQFKGSGQVYVDPRGVDTGEVPDGLVKKLRGSYYLWGVLLARRGWARSYLPGGCQIGKRPIDLHLKGFRALGAEIDIRDQVLEVRAKRLQGARIYMDYPSVGATINIMLAASLAEGETVIENAAKEPEIVDVANFLTIMGARVRGSGTDIIKIQGVKELHGAEHRIIPDRIEAGTFLLAAAITGGDVYVNNVLSEHLKSVISKLKEMGMIIEEAISGIHISANGSIKAADIKTLPYPGFPTDLQAQGMALLTQTSNCSRIIETVWEDRFNHVDQLQKMGAQIRLEDSGVVINPGPLKGARVRATDLRAGAALIIAGLVASGRTEITDLYHIKRGYEGIHNKLKSLGARIELREKEDNPR